MNGVALSDRLLSAFDDDNTKPRKVSGIQAGTLRGHWTDLSVSLSTDFVSAVEKSLPYTLTDGIVILQPHNSVPSPRFLVFRT